MTYQTVADRVRAIIEPFTIRDIADLSSADTLHELGITDAGRIEIGLEIEALVEGGTTDDDVEACKTVGDFVALAERLAGPALAAL